MFHMYSKSSGLVVTEGPLQKLPCTAPGCNVLVTIGHPYCTKHLVEHYGVKIAPSQIPGAGNGLYTTKPLLAGSYIVPYIGEVISDADFDKRYNSEGITAPYTVAEDDGTYIDAAYIRGVGATANTQVSRHGMSLLRLCNSHLVDHPNSIYPVWLQARVDIAPGEEIYVFYGTEYRLKSSNHTTTLLHE
jgi:hypothetical protein